MGICFSARSRFLHVCPSCFTSQTWGFDESIVFCEDHDYAQRFKEFGKFGFLRSTKIPVSIRRLDRDGRMKIAMKYLLAELHLAFVGPIRSNRFHYTFGHEN